MKIRIVSIVFPPDSVSTAQLIGEVATDLADRGHDVSVVTTEPHYNPDAASPDNISWGRTGLLGKRSVDQLSVECVRMPRKARSRFGRILQWAWFHIIVAIRAPAGEPDAILLVSPPPSLALAASAAPWRRATRRTVLAVWELYPDILASMGVLRRDGLPFRALRRLEGATYRACDHITFLTEEMRALAVRNHPQVAARATVLSTFADTDELRPLPRPTALRCDLGIETDFVVGYGGNLGPAQGLKTLVDAARLLGTTDPDIRFLFCGGGTGGDELLERAAGLPNVVFAGQLPYSRVPEMYSTFDVSIVPLAAGIGGEALPSKLIRSLACGVPVLAVADPRTPLATFVEKTGTGWAVAPAKAEALAEALRVAHADPDRPVMGAAGRAIAKQRFDRANIVLAYERLLKGVG